MRPVIRTPVPCNGCTACCRGEFVVLFPERGDDPKTYDHDVIPSEECGDIAVLRHKPNGDCVYLGERGCTIHERAPAVCRAFDCRQYFLSMPRVERRQMQRQAEAKIEIFAAARERLGTLSDAERADAMRRRATARPEVNNRKSLRDTMLG